MTAYLATVAALWPWLAFIAAILFVADRIEARAHRVTAAREAVRLAEVRARGIDVGIARMDADGSGHNR